ncbi:MAG: hypothetical protein ABSF90_20945 [Syntrophobacteraceae bacterium]|jgi:hypothetical protein
MRKIINGKVYDTDTAQIMASDRYWDGNNMERNGRNQYLYVTPRGAFFSYRFTMWQGELDSITPLDKGDAKSLYEKLPEQDIEAYTRRFGEAEEA